MTGFDDTLDMECGRKRKIKDDLKSGQLSLMLNKAMMKTWKVV